MKQFLRFIITMVCVVAEIYSAMAQPSSLPEERMRNARLPLGRLGSSAYESSPAVMFYRDSVSMSCLVSGYDLERYDEPFMMQLGTGRSILSIEASSYMKNLHKSVVWGNAVFRTGNYRDIRWTDCVDYIRLAPYVLGDAVGGDMSSREYVFGGGWARLSHGWTFGISTSYRARVDYRNRDPRVKTVVSDLNADVGVSRRISADHSIGVSVGINVYDQNCDVDFYNPMNDIDTYTLTGMGTYYARFMGNTNKNSGYDAFCYRIGVQCVSDSHEGLTASILYENGRNEQLLRNYNNITLGYTDATSLNIGVGYHAVLSRSFSALPYLKVEYFNRGGTENLFGTVSSGSYPLIGRRLMYHNVIKTYSVTAPLQFGRGSCRGVVTVVPAICYTVNHEWYVSPVRDVEVAMIEPSLQIDYQRYSDLWLWRISLGGSGTMIDNKTAVFEGLDTASDLGKCLLHNYAMLASSRRRLCVCAGISRMLGSYLWGIDFSFTVESFAGHGRHHGMSGRLSVKF